MAVDFSDYIPILYAFEYPGKIEGFINYMETFVSDLDDAKYTASIGTTILDMTVRIQILETDYTNATGTFDTLSDRIDSIDTILVSLQDGTGIESNAITEEKLLISNDPQDGYILSYNTTLGQMTWIEASSAGGSVGGPETSTLNGLAKFDSVDGSTIASTSIVIDTNDNMSGHGVTLVSYATSHTLTSSDRGKVLTLTGTGAKTISCPEASTLNDGFHCVVLNRGTGAVTIAKVDAGDTLEAKGPSMDGQYSAATIVKIDDNTWAAYGDLVT